MPVEISGIFEGTPHTVPLRQIVEKRSFFRLVAVNFQAKYPEAHIVQSTADDLEGSKFLGNEEHGFAFGKDRRNEVSDGLRLPGTRRSFDDKILPAERVDQCAMLRAVRIPDQMWDVFLDVVRIDRVLLGQRDIRTFRAFEQFAYKRVLGNALARGPGLRVKIPIHQKLAKAEERECNLSAYGPALLELQNLGEFFEVSFRGIVIFDERYLKAEIPAQFFQKGQIGLYVLTRVFKHRFNGAPLPAGALNGHRDDDQGSKMRLFGVVGFVPLQESEHEVEHVRAGFLDSRPGCGRDLAAYRVELLLVVQDWQGLDVAILGLVEVKGGIPSKFLRVVLGGRTVRPAHGFRFRHRQKGKLVIVTEACEHGINPNLDNSQGRRVGMSEIEEFVTVGEVEQPGADSVKADLGTARQEIRTDVRGWLFDCFSARTVWHGCS